MTGENKTEEYAVMPEEVRRAIAKLKGKVFVPDAQAVRMQVPVSAEIMAEECHKEAEALKNLTPGQEIPGQGVFIGTWQLNLSQKFNVFAAPEDLTDASGNKKTFKYVDAVKRIASLKNWHGYDGTNYETDRELPTALKYGSYNGGWIIPPRELLMGKDYGGNATQPDNIYAHKDKGALRGTFCIVASGCSGMPDWYWSSTDSWDSSSVRTVRLSDGYEGCNSKDITRLRCRPVRLVEVKP